ncbi:hypothetical protein LTR36_009729 [Oleoguttula mirabilis]|uniref:Uncharacterized protein n=1 Tax=Oleoguttula mirabilis TaxID=1507867 RepID=A0AAV9J5K0_9PEZI|nr:hypothetical protein LTR36_009729 [Oleoguttula mirabilis]
MLSQTILLAASAFAASALAQQTAGITIEASHGGAGSDLTNTTITVPLNMTYTNAALNEVSNLYLTSASGVPLESITCTPHLYANGTGEAGLAFTSSEPSLLSTNTVQVGSITCVSTTTSSSDTSAAASASSGATSTAASTGTAIAIPTIQNGTALLTTASLTASTTSSASEIVSTVSDAISTFLTTVPAAAASGTSQQSTITSVMTASDSATAPTSATATSAQSASSTSSTSASLTSGNAAGRLSLADFVWPGLAVGALGLAMAV